MTSPTGLQSQFNQLGSLPMDSDVEASVLHVHNEIISNHMPAYTQEGFDKQCEEYERQKREYKYLNGFEWSMDGWGRERGTGRDEQGGVWFGER